MIFDPLELNYTKVKAWLDCPHLYKYCYIDRKFTPHSPFSALGISVHRALHRFHSQGGGLDGLILYYDEGWHHGGYGTPQQSMEFYNLGRKILENYWKADAAADRRETLFTEREFEFEFERWRIRGTIDRVDRVPGGCEVIDYKMGFEDRTAGDLKKDLQLAIYALAVQKAFGLEARSVAWFLLVKGEKISVPYDPASADALLALLRDTGEKILALDLSRKGNCAACSIRALCAVSEAKN